METLSSPVILEAVTRPSGLRMPAVIEALRPSQWVKNGFVLAALIFAQKLTDHRAVIEACSATLIFCAASSVVYLFNDVLDVESDRLHPVKRFRPVASGRVRPVTALFLAVLFAACALPASWMLGRALFGLVLFYLLLNVAYSAWLKHVLLLDVFVIAAGFVLRVVAGGVAIHVPVSSWLIICTTLLALFMALSKRRHELVALGERCGEHRSSLAHYSRSFLDQLIAIVTASTIMSYALYTQSAEVRARFPGRHLALTVPFVIFAIFRYLFLVHQREEGGNPARTLLTDSVLLSVVLLWATSVVWIIYF